MTNPGVANRSLPPAVAIASRVQHSDNVARVQAQILGRVGSIVGADRPEQIAFQWRALENGVNGEAFAEVVAAIEVDELLRTKWQHLHFSA